MISTFFKINLFALFIVAQLHFAQETLNPNQFEGYVITNAGKKIEGIIEVSNAKHPWSFQGTISFFDKSILDEGKAKRKDKTKYKPTDLLEYGIGDRKFKPVEYVDSNQADNNALNETIGMIRSVTKTKHFAELYHEGAISVYRFYSSPPGFSASAGQGQIDAYDDFVEKCKTTYDILIENDGEKAKSFESVNLKKFFKSCSYVVKKYENNEYIKKPVKGLKSLIKDALLQGEPLANAAMEMVKDYEANCK